MSTLKNKYKNDVIQSLMKRFEYKNIMMVPKIKKIVINRGLGEVLTNSKAMDETIEQLIKITGQQPVKTKSKKAISNFKIREKQYIGSKVTLRKEKMYDFLTKLLYISLPKIRDFRGLSSTSFDGRGNYTLGMKEDLIFPENNKEVTKIRGFDITFVTSASTDYECYELLRLLGLPFRNEFNKKDKD